MQLAVIFIQKRLCLESRYDTSHCFVFISCCQCFCHWAIHWLLELSFLFVCCTNNLDDMIYNSWDIACNRLKLVNYGWFFALFIPMNPRPPSHKKKTKQNKTKQNIEKIKNKNCWWYNHFTHVPKKNNHMTYGSWDTKWDTEWDRHNFLSFWVIFALLPLYQPEKITILQSDIWQSYDVWFLRYGEWQTQFLSFYARGYHFLHVCTTNDDHIRYGYWDMKCDRQNLLSFWAIFYPFTLLTSWKIKSKKKKKHLEISSFYTCVQQMTIIWCMIPEIWCMTDIFFSF